MTLSLSNSSFIPATTNLQLGTLTVEGLKPGTVSVTVNKAALMYVTDANDNTATIYPNGGSGSLQVTGTPDPDTHNDCSDNRRDNGCDNFCYNTTNNTTDYYNYGNNKSHN